MNLRQFLSQSSPQLNLLLSNSRSSRGPTQSTLFTIWAAGHQQSELDLPSVLVLWDDTLLERIFHKGKGALDLEAEVSQHHLHAGRRWTERIADQSTGLVFTNEIGVQSFSMILIYQMAMEILSSRGRTFSW